MKDDIEKIYTKLVNLETEVSNLRQGYITVNARYAEALGTLKALTSSALEAAKRAAISAEKASLSAKNCATAAKLAASEAIARAMDAVQTQLAQAGAVEARAIMRILEAGRSVARDAECLAADIESDQSREA